ncbi:DUF6192 family protein [Streptomyces sp. NPDC090798]|uniref:DUF6192 family protein n=1 Tax=Streptomyces sp. NPDC090798 TaxID=3365968 RepID=UPI00381FFAA5
MCRRIILPWALWVGWSVPSRDDTVAQQVTMDLLRRPDVARKTMRDDYPDYGLTTA